jgi:hypothetical protein
MSYRSLRLASALLAAAAALPGCATEEGIPSEELSTNLGAWHDSPYKDCTVGSAFGHPEWDGEVEPQPALDAEWAYRKLGFSLAVTEGSEAVVFGAPRPPSRRSESVHRVVVEGYDGDEEVELRAILDEQGICTVSQNGDVWFRRQLWGALPIAAQVKPVMPAPRESDFDLFGDERAQFGAMYLELGALEVVADALAGDAPRAAALLARKLGLAEADVASLVVAEPASLPYVENGSGTAPFSIRAAGAPDPMPFYRAPTLAVSASQGIFVPERAGARSLRVMVTHSAMSILSLPDVPTSIHAVDLALRIDRVAADRARATVETVTLGGAGSMRGANCVRQVANTTLAYLASPARANGSVRVPMVISTRSTAAVSSHWLTYPCGSVSPDLAADIRDSAEAMAALGQLLDPASYPNGRDATSIDPSDWDQLLARIAPYPSALSALSSAIGVHRILDPGIAGQRAILADARYTAMPAAEQELRRQAAWRVALTCGSEPSPAMREDILTYSLDQLRVNMLANDTCVRR